MATDDPLSADPVIEMKLSELARRIDGGRMTGDDVEVQGVAHDSRDVRPGDLFACLVGEKFDGHRFAADAAVRGAVALCIQQNHVTDVTGNFPCIVVPDTRLALHDLACAVYGDPSAGLTLIGVTGTNGKTTTTLLMASILRAAGLKTGTIGTLGAELMGEPLPSERTTPEADQLQRLLAEIRDRRGQAVAMEVSSHALDLHRADGCRFDAAIFTNLTQDHLDFHGTLDAYFESKLRLFRDYPETSGKPFVGAVNLDDPRGEKVAEKTRGRVITYAVARSADVMAPKVRYAADRAEFTAQTPIGQLDIMLPIGGAFQVYNALGAIAAAAGLGIQPDAIVQGLADTSPVPGRFESVPTGRRFHVIVDYAHTPDGLKNLLDSAQHLSHNRLIVVFGCGGDRDPTKRPIMGRIVASSADLAIVTSDNPRSEDPCAIIEAIVNGMNGGRYIVQADRRKAIASALEEAKEGDIVLIAGKGHEDYQEIKGVKYPFDDRQVVRELLASLPAPMTGAGSGN